MANQNAKPLALITDASTGIGFELAVQFAENGFDLIISSEHVRAEALEFSAHTEEHVGVPRFFAFVGPIFVFIPF